MNLQFLYLLVANAILILLMRMSKNRKWLHTTLTFLCTALITLTIIEGVYRLFFKSKALTETGNYGASFNEPSTLTGYTVKNISPLRVTKRDNQGNLVYDASYTIIPDSGFNKLPINHRAAYRINDPSRDSVEIVFLGCSFTFATGINDTATMAYRTGQQLQYNSVNYGGSGYGTHQPYQIFMHKYQHVPDHKKRVLVYTFLPDHVLRAKCIYSWCFNDPFFEVEQDSLVLKGPAYKHSGSARWQIWVRALSLNRALSFIADLGNAIIQQKGAASVGDQDYRRIGLMLDRINKTIRQRGDTFVIPHWNDYVGAQKLGGGYYVSPEKTGAIMKELAEEGAVIVPITSFFNTGQAENLIPKDNHPSAQGNALLSDHVSGIIRGLLNASIGN